MSLGSESLKLVLPWPPSVNNYKTVGAIVKTKTGKLFQQRNNSIQTKEFYWEVYSIVKAQMGFKTPKSYLDSTITLSVAAYLYPPPGTASRRWDADNRLKVLLDSLVRAGVIADDSQIARLLVEKRESFPDGKVEVEIYPIG